MYCIVHFCTLYIGYHKSEKHVILSLWDWIISLSLMVSSYNDYIAKTGFNVQMVYSILQCICHVILTQSLDIRVAYILSLLIIQLKKKRDSTDGKIFLGKIHRKWMGHMSDLFSVFLRNLHSIFHNICAALHSYKQRFRVLCPQILACIYFFLIFE